MSRKETMKVYHGIPKSITDEHTIFYLNDNNNILINASRSHRTPVSVGYTDFKGTDGFVRNITSLKELTVDFWIDNTNYTLKTDSTILSILNQNNDRVIVIDQPKFANGNLYFSCTNSINQNGNFAVCTGIDRGLNHIRCTINKMTMSIYVNGKISTTEDCFINWENGLKKIMLFTASKNDNTLTSVYNLKGTVISDLHISDIDRGDYFPNLPQDFIDGKAIIKPRFGQQQIKGDPLYNQYTLDKVKIGHNVNEPQITCSITSGEWANGDTIKVKGLDGNIVTGVIDSDTALCKILKYEVEGGTTAKIYVDSVAKLSVNDKLRSLHPKTMKYGAEELTITDINASSKLITLSGTNSNYTNTTLSSGWNTLVEITSASSSPVVKTEDGATVVGAWSGLGTNKAIFTLGDNSNILGKDLYVEYSLIIPNNNSDFNELPYSIDKAYAENGIEMTPVDKVVISDDFKGKISNSTKECPHFAGFYKSNALASPNSFAEYKSYNILYYEDGTLASLSTTESGEIPQNIFSFNLIEMVERKMGCEIPAIDKATWLRSNLENTGVLSVYGYGVNGDSNLLTLSIYDVTTNSWFGAETNSTNEPSKIQLTFTTLTDRRITDDGFLHAIVYGGASNNTTSTIYIDYISLKIKLKLDSTYTTLYCSNSRAREDKCNPVLIQKETKTVKRYLPSKECFVTECKYVDMDRKLLSTSDMNSYYYKGTKVYSTTRGSGEYNSHTGVYPNIINLLRIPDYEAYTYKCGPLKNSPVTAKINMSFTEQLGESYTGNTLSAMPTELYAVLKYIQLVPFIRLNNGEIELMLYTSEVVDSGIEDYSKQMSKNYVYAYKLPNKPLIK